MNFSFSSKGIFFLVSNLPSFIFEDAGWSLHSIFEVVFHCLPTVIFRIPNMTIKISYSQILKSWFILYNTLSSEHIKNEILFRESDQCIQVTKFKKYKTWDPKSGSIYSNCFEHLYYLNFFACTIWYLKLSWPHRSYSLAVKFVKTNSVDCQSRT